MGKNDVAVGRWLADKRRFADLFNGILFHGEQIICPEALVPMDRESDLLVVDKEGKSKALKRYRDVVMRWREEVDFVVLASENQEKIHYAMPVRNMLYDSLSYVEQIELLWKTHLANKDKMTREEFLSHFKKEDKICPVITIVFYYGDKCWDGSVDIHGMFSEELLSSRKEILEKYVPNYRINLVDAARVEEPELFRSDLQVIFGMLKYRSNKNKLLGYIHEHEGYFGNIDQETYQAIRAFLNSDKQMGKLLLKDQKEGINMCRALEELYEEGVENGMKQGMEQGEERVNRLIILLTENGRNGDIMRSVSDREYQRKLFEEYGI